MQSYKNRIFLTREYLHRKKSVQEIADDLRVSCHKIIYWMDKHGIKRRNRSEAIYIKYNPKGDPFKIKEKFSHGERALFYLGIGLYLGEGAKSFKRGVVAFGNTDPLIIRTFLKFLKIICDVDSDKIKFELNIYDDVSLQSALEYWTRVTEMPLSSFSKSIIRKAREKGTYKHWSRYGTLTIRVNNKKLLGKILEWCRESVSHFSNVETWLHVYTKAEIAQLAEHFIGSEEATGSIPVLGSLMPH